jgi:hypothetical protein
MVDKLLDIPPLKGVKPYKGFIYENFVVYGYVTPAGMYLFFIYDESNEDKMLNFTLNQNFHQAEEEAREWCYERSDTAQIKFSAVQQWLMA